MRLQRFVFFGTLNAPSVCWSSSIPQCTAVVCGVHVKLDTLRHGRVDNGCSRGGTFGSLWCLDLPKNSLNIPLRLTADDTDSNIKSSSQVLAVRLRYYVRRFSGTTSCGRPAVISRVLCLLNELLSVWKATLSRRKEIGF